MGIISSIRKRVGQKREKALRKQLKRTIKARFSLDKKYDYYLDRGLAFIISKIGAEHIRNAKKFYDGFKKKR